MRCKSRTIQGDIRNFYQLFFLFQDPFEVQKKLEEVRLLESRKSARLADQDTDFARLADMAGDRKRTASHTIDVPAPSYHG